MTLRAGFLIVVAGVALHLSIWAVVATGLAYMGCAEIDSWLARRAKNKAIDYEMDGWEPDPKDPECEDKGALSRVRLIGKDQIIVARMAHILRRI